jgi:hypothetical protein
MTITSEIHRELAVSLNNEAWQLLGETNRDAEADARLVNIAHACLHHWLQVGTAVNAQRGEWLISHVYAVLGLGEAALRHAERCAHITEANPSEMKDFDAAYAGEGLARAHAVLGRTGEAADLRAKAEEAGKAIADEEDRKIFMGDLESGPWPGLT